MGDDSHEQKTPLSDAKGRATRGAEARPQHGDPHEGDDRDNAPGHAPGHAPDHAPDYERELGVIEAITFVTRSCPSGVVISAAEGALEAIKKGGPGVMKQQAYFVLSAIKGWRGERARQVHRSLAHYLEGTSSKPGSPT